MRALLAPDGVKADLTMHPESTGQLIESLRLVPRKVELEVMGGGETWWACGRDDTGSEYTVFAPFDYDPEVLRRLVAEVERHT